MQAPCGLPGGADLYKELLLRFWARGLLCYGVNLPCCKHSLAAGVLYLCSGWLLAVPFPSTAGGGFWAGRLSGTGHDCLLITNLIGNVMKEQPVSWGRRGQAASAASDLLKLASHLQDDGMEDLLDQGARKGVQLGVQCL